MRVREIWVKQLYGIFDHPIPLHLDERITIIHGPNGFGKTFILRMVVGLFSGRYGIFRKAPFREFGVRFDDDKVLRVTPRDQVTRSDSPPPPGAARAQTQLELSLHDGDAEVERVDLDKIDWHAHREGRAEIIHFLERRTPLARISATMWRDVSTGERMTLNEAVERYAHMLPLQTDVPASKEPEWLTVLRKQIPVRFIQTHRLDSFTTDEVRHDEPGARVPTVKNYSDDLTREMQRVLANYAKKANQLDSTFPDRLFKLPTDEVLSSEQLVDKLIGLETKRARLNLLGFLDPGEGLRPPEHALARNRDALSVYVRDVEEKLSAFDELAAKINLLQNIVNERFRYKKLTISREHGFVFTSDVGARLTATDLSSGEQHELVLLYELLFKLQKNSLVLIDEPEISLHVVWQQQFLDDLQKMVEVSGFDVIIATHSPQLIGSHWDLTVGLEGPEHRPNAG